MPRSLHDFAGVTLPYQLPLPKGAIVLMVRSDNPVDAADAQFTVVLAVPSVGEVIGFYDGVFHTRTTPATLMVDGREVDRDVGIGYEPSALAPGEVVRFIIRVERGTGMIVYVRRLEDADERLGNGMTSWFHLEQTHPYVAEVVLIGPKR